MNKLLRSFLYATLIIVSMAVAGHSQGQQDAASILVRVVGLDGAERSVTREDWAKLPRATVKAVDHSGVPATFEGVAARDLLKLVGAPLGHELRGQLLSVYVLAEASDGYKVVYALPEFDTDFTDGVILVADGKDGEALAAKEGPLRIVVPWEKRPARWIRELTALRLLQAR